MCFLKYQELTGKLGVVLVLIEVRGFAAETNRRQAGSGREWGGEIVLHGRCRSTSNCRSSRSCPLLSTRWQAHTVVRQRLFNYTGRRTERRGGPKLGVLHEAFAVVVRLYQAKVGAWMNFVAKFL